MDRTNNVELRLRARKFILDKKNWLLLILVGVYILSPADLLPGPVDDLLVAVLYGAFRKKLLAAF